MVSGNIRWNCDFGPCKTERVACKWFTHHMSRLWQVNEFVGTDAEVYNQKRK